MERTCASTEYDAVLAVARERRRGKKLVAIGIDLGKTTFHIAGTDAEGRVVLRKRLSRSQLLTFFATLPPTLIAMEACCGAHWLARELVGFWP